MTVQSLRPALAGVGLGLLLAVALADLIRNQLFGVVPLEPRVYLAAAALMLTTAVAASYLPVRRAIAGEPMRALKNTGSE